LAKPKLQDEPELWSKLTKMALDKFKDECGVMAVHNHLEASTMAYLGLHQLQHRGQESAGIVSSNGERLFIHKAMGEVAGSFPAIWLSDIRVTPLPVILLCSTRSPSWSTATRA
jgi:hypothetical protein